MKLIKSELQQTEKEQNQQIPPQKNEAKTQNASLSVVLRKEKPQKPKQLDISQIVQAVQPKTQKIPLNVEYEEELD